jgi:hypothetical protein
LAGRGPVGNGGSGGSGGTVAGAAFGTRAAVVGGGGAGVVVGATVVVVEVVVDVVVLVDDVVVDGRVVVEASEPSNVSPPPQAVAVRATRQRPANSGRLAFRRRANNRVSSCGFPPCCPLGWSPHSLRRPVPLHRHRSAYLDPFGTGRSG